MGAADVSARTGLGWGNLELGHAGGAAASAGDPPLGGFADPMGQFSDTAAKADRASELGEFVGPLEMMPGFVPFAADMPLDRQVARPHRLGAGEAPAHPVD